MYDRSPGGPEHAKMMVFDIPCRPCRVFVDPKPPAPAEATPATSGPENER